MVTTVEMGCKRSTTLSTGKDMSEAWKRKIINRELSQKRTCLRTINCFPSLSYRDKKNNSLFYGFINFGHTSAGLGQVESQTQDLLQIIMKSILFSFQLLVGYKRLVTSMLLCVWIGWYIPIKLVCNSPGHSHWKSTYQMVSFFSWGPKRGLAWERIAKSQLQEKKIKLLYDSHN